MEIIGLIEFSSNDPHGNFKKGDTGTLLGFVNGGDNTPCGVVLHNGIYEAVPLYFLHPLRQKVVNLEVSVHLYDKW